MVIGLASSLLPPMAALGSFDDDSFGLCAAGTLVGSSSSALHSLFHPQTAAFRPCDVIGFGIMQVETEGYVGFFTRNGIDPQEDIDFRDFSSVVPLMFPAASCGEGEALRFNLGPAWAAFGGQPFRWNVAAFAATSRERGLASLRNLPAPSVMAVDTLILEQLLHSGYATAFEALRRELVVEHGIGVRGRVAAALAAGASSPAWREPGAYERLALAATPAVAAGPPPPPPPLAAAAVEAAGGPQLAERSSSMALDELVQQQPPHWQQRESPLRASPLARRLRFTPAALELEAPLPYLVPVAPSAAELPAPVLADAAATGADVEDFSAAYFTALASGTLQAAILRVSPPTQLDELLASHECETSAHAEPAPSPAPPSVIPACHWRHLFSDMLSPKEIVQVKLSSLALRGRVRALMTAGRFAAALAEIALHAPHVVASAPHAAALAASVAIARVIEALRRSDTLSALRIVIRDVQPYFELHERSSASCSAEQRASVRTADTGTVARIMPVLRATLALFTAAPAAAAAAGGAATAATSAASAASGVSGETEEELAVALPPLALRASVPAWVPAHLRFLFGAQLRDAIADNANAALLEHALAAAASQRFRERRPTPGGHGLRCAFSHNTDTGALEVERWLWASPGALPPARLAIDIDEGASQSSQVLLSPAPPGVRVGSSRSEPHAAGGEAASSLAADAAAPAGLAEALVAYLRVIGITTPVGGGTSAPPPPPPFSPPHAAQQPASDVERWIMRAAAVERAETSSDARIAAVRHSLLYAALAPQPERGAERLAVGEAAWSCLLQLALAPPASAGGGGGDGSSRGGGEASASSPRSVGSLQSPFALAPQPAPPRQAPAATPSHVLASALWQPSTSAQTAAGTAASARRERVADALLCVLASRYAASSDGLAALVRMRTALAAAAAAACASSAPPVVQPRCASLLEAMCGEPPLVPATIGRDGGASSSTAAAPASSSTSAPSSSSASPQPAYILPPSFFIAPDGSDAPTSLLERMLSRLATNESGQTDACALADELQEALEVVYEL